ncbi:MAG: cation diffusion facilitator family transporter [Halanaerobium sp.]
MQKTEKNKHSHDHHSHHTTSNIKFAFFLNLIFTILEIIGGLWTNSMAILSDALHDFGDSISLGLSWFLESYSKKGADKKFTFGYSRFSLLGAMINGIVLFIGSFIILSEAVPRILNPQSVNASGMFMFAVVGIIFNGAAVLRLKKGDSINEKVVSLHLLEDVLGWTAVMIVSIVLMFKDIAVLDPILSITITLYVLFNVYKNLKEVFNLFLQGVPEDIDVDKIKNKMQENTEILEVHHIHVWSLKGERIFLSAHVMIDDSWCKEDIIKIKEKLKSLLKKEGIEHVTLEIEFENESCDHNNCL